MLSLFYPYIRRREICIRLLIKLKRGSIYITYSWDSRNYLSKLSLLLFQYWSNTLKLVGFTRLISYFSFYSSLLALICILLPPSLKPRRFPPNSRNDPEPKGTTTQDTSVFVYSSTGGSTNTQGLCELSSVPSSFNIGDQVWLLRRHIKTTSPCEQLDYRRLGPFHSHNSI